MVNPDRFRYSLHCVLYGLGGLPHFSDHIRAQLHRFLVLICNCYNYISALKKKVNTQIWPPTLNFTHILGIVYLISLKQISGMNSIGNIVGILPNFYF